MTKRTLDSPEPLNQKTLSDLILNIGLASVEAYNLKTNEWFFVAPMNTRRSSVGVGVVEGKNSKLLFRPQELYWV